MDGKQEKKIWFWLFILFAAGCLAYSVNGLFLHGPLRENLFGRNGQKALWETIFFFIWTMAVFFFSEYQSGKWRLGLQFGGISLVFLAEIWCHQIFLPVLVSGFWLLGLLLFGDGIFCLSAKNHEPESWLKRLTADLIFGFGFWISLTCFLSAFHIGGLGRMRKTAAVLVFMALLSAVQKGKKNWKQALNIRIRERARLDRTEQTALAVILTMIFIQLARINLLPDYDSLHYGLRSPYILDVGNGIYEDLGNINLVYTYAKGFEILAYPLAGTATFGYQLCFNVWMAVLVLVLVYGITAELGKKRKTALWACASVSAMPGIMNMAITAKSDLSTLVCQLCIICAAVEIFVEKTKKEKREWTGIAAGSCFLSYSMKPTALVFSTVLSLSCLAVLIGKKGFVPEEREEKFLQKGQKETRFLAASILLPLFSWTGTWFRTYKMTGVPTTSVFTSIWERLGFQVRWPYAFSSIPNQGLALGGTESIFFLLKRLAGILFVPVGEDMAHVIIAWGGLLPVLFFLAWMIWGRPMRKKKESGCLCGAAAGIGIISLISIYLLWQVDGNYFMLMYTLLAILGSLSLDKAVSPVYAGRIFASIFLFFQAAVTLSTNWAGTTGFTPAVLCHPGYYRHQQEWYQRKCQEGNQAIWSFLAQDPKTRVIAFGEHPQVLQFPCNVQSYYDVTGSGGNVRLVKTLENFKDFLRFARTDYLYVEAGYLEEGSRAYDVVRFLIEEGSLADICYENGNMLGRVNLDGAVLVNPEEEAEKFYRMIITAEKQNTG